MSLFDNILGRGQPLRLYYMDYCSYCHRVTHAADKFGVKVQILNIYSDRAARERLQNATGRTRVPVLGILDEDGKESFMPESEDIIEYLRSLKESNSA